MERQQSFLRGGPARVGPSPHATASSTGALLCSPVESSSRFPPNAPLPPNVFNLLVLSSWTRDTDSTLWQEVTGNRSIAVSRPLKGGDVVDTLIGARRGNTTSAVPAVLRTDDELRRLELLPKVGSSQQRCFFAKYSSVGALFEWLRRECDPAWQPRDQPKGGSGEGGHGGSGATRALLDSTSFVRAALIHAITAELAQYTTMVLGLHRSLVDDATDAKQQTQLAAASLSESTASPDSSLGYDDLTPPPDIQQRAQVACREAPLSVLTRVHDHSMAPLRTLRTLMVQCDKKRGGEVISELQSALAQCGVLHARNVLRRVLRAVLLPFAEVTVEWMTEGTTATDRFEEFFVVVVNDIPDRRFWADKFQLRESRAPAAWRHRGEGAPLHARIFNLGKSVAFIRRFLKSTWCIDQSLQRWARESVCAPPATQR